MAIYNALSPFKQYCPKCNDMVSISLTGKCKKCGAATDSSFYIDSEKWDNMTMDEKADYLSNNGKVEKNEETEEIEEVWEPFITTCPSFEGKHIDHYLGTVYGTEIYLVGGLLGGGLSNQENLFGAAFSRAKKRMYNKAIALGGNAVVSLQTVVMSPGSTADIIVVVTGTAVSISE